MISQGFPPCFDRPRVGVVVLCGHPIAGMVRPEGPFYVNKRSAFLLYLRDRKRQSGTYPLPTAGGFEISQKCALTFDIYNYPRFSGREKRLSTPKSPKIALAARKVQNCPEKLREDISGRHRFPMPTYSSFIERCGSFPLTPFVLLFFYNMFIF